MIPLPSTAFSTGAAFTIDMPPRTTNPLVAVNLSNESSVTILIQLGVKFYDLPPQSTATYPLDNTEQQIILDPRTSPVVTGAVYGVVYEENDPQPLSLSRGSNLQGGGVAGLPIDPLILTAAGTIVLGTQASGDTVDRFKLAVNGTMQWGPGNGAVDVQLARTSAGVLTLTGGINISTGIVVSGGIGILTGGITIAAGGLTVTGNTVLNNNLTVVAGGLTVTAGGLTVSANGFGVIGASSINGLLTISSGGLSVVGSPSGYNDELRFATGGAGAAVAISSLSTGTPQMMFDHRGNPNTGEWYWRNTANAAATVMKLNSAGTLQSLGGGFFGNGVFGGAAPFVQLQDFVGQAWMFAGHGTLADCSLALASKGNLPINFFDGSLVQMAALNEVAALAINQTCLTLTFKDNGGAVRNNNRIRAETAPTPGAYYLVTY